jgi:hypothetical protein
MGDPPRCVDGVCRAPALRRLTHRAKAALFLLAKAPIAPIPVNKTSCNKNCKNPMSPVSHAPADPITANRERKTTSCKKKRIPFLCFMHVLLIFANKKAFCAVIAGEK